MNIGVLILLIIGGLSFLGWVLFFVYKLMMNRVRRKILDKPLVVNHKFKIRPPTWRFQKYSPSRCPHHNGVFRKVEINILDETIKKTIFVCADCVSIIEKEELERRDKFKK